MNGIINLFPPCIMIHTRKSHSRRKELMCEWHALRCILSINYHVHLNETYIIIISFSFLPFFHCCCHHPPSFCLESLKLQRNINKYDILKDTNSDDDDKFQFAFTRKSLEILGFSSEEILSIFKIIAVILKLGNLNFIPITNIDGSEGCEISNDYGNSLHKLNQIVRSVNWENSICRN